MSSKFDEEKDKFNYKIEPSNNPKSKTKDDIKRDDSSGDDEETKNILEK